MDLNITWSDVPWTAYRSHYKETHSDLAIPGWVVAHEGECRFRDCRHDHKPGCAINQALADGTIRPDRYRSYRQLRDESQVTVEMLLQRRREWGKQISKFSRELKKARES